MTEQEALAWCRANGALVRFDAAGTVTVKVGEFRRRRPTFVEAVAALAEHLA